MRREMLTFRRFIREHDAGPIVEFAIIVPVLLLMLIGIIDLAWAFNRRNSYVTGVREGARFAAVSVDPCGSADIIRGIVNSRIVPRRDSVPWANITVTSRTGACIIPGDSSITVRVANVPYTGMTGIPLPSFIGQAINLSASATFRWERAW